MPSKETGAKARVSQRQSSPSGHKTKWVIVTGGVVSGLGKGTASASIGKLLSRNFKVVPIKCDGYLNVDPGTMNPFEHGEVFVLEDGGEVDMDFGHYERFLDINCKKEWNLTTGKIFESIIRKERQGFFLGKTVQVIPHVTNEIKARWLEIANSEKAGVVLIEIGGTIGDIENSWFIEAARQLKKEVGPENILYVHLSYVPYVRSIGQQKTKPAQRDVETLRSLGILPDVIIGRSEEDLTAESKQKIALFCDVSDEAVISGKDIETIYEVPVMFEEQGMVSLLARRFGFSPAKDLTAWRNLIAAIKAPKYRVKVAICGKYTVLNDSYASLIESLRHAGANLNCGVDITFVETTDFEDGKVTVDSALHSMDAIIVPIGFGARGVEGKISAVKFARERKVPFLGLCFGLQLAVVEFARNVCGLKDANSTEASPKTSHPVVMILPEQRSVKDLGGTMRLGAETAQLRKGSIVAELYRSNVAVERHRHRYEVNPKYHSVLERNGLVISGSSRNGKLVEFIELPQSAHPYFTATQAHPEYKSRLERPSPLYYGLIRAAIERKYRLKV
ncbi:CTP synthase (glutamine hydrolyzing) [Candidatus Woesearchaeota archaeon]|nr:CTP synthase (glutamine hydrolyzing) [Candidatus Woesearchaeota archaeon]